jgi:hypothetical protein
MLLNNSTIFSEFCGILVHFPGLSEWLLQADAHPAEDYQPLRTNPFE